MFHCITVTGEGVKPTTNLKRNEVNKAIHIAKQSTASIGKFEEKLVGILFGCKFIDFLV